MNTMNKKKEQDDFVNLLNKFIEKNPDAKKDILWLMAYHLCEKNLLNKIKDLADDDQEIMQIINRKLNNSDEFY